MSLDVYLEDPMAPCQPETVDKIFIRESGQTVEISREEWERRYPGHEPAVCRQDIRSDNRVYSANITHNLAKMADAAGLYEALWRPEEIGASTAAQLAIPLRAGLSALQGDPGTFRKLNPENGWGTYESLVRFVEAYLEACEQYPNATVSVCR